MHAGEVIPKPKKSIMERMSMSFFVTNFPHHVTTKDLWSKCAHWGTVCDVFIAKRLSKVGKRFAFVRYIKVNDANKLLSNLNSMWIDKYKVYADLVRFNRSFNNRPPMKEPVAASPAKKVSPTPGTNSSSSGKSYAEALSGQMGSNNVLPKRRTIKITSYAEKDHESKLSVLLKLNEPSSIPYAKLWLNSEGFLDLDVFYIGGRWLLVSCGSLETKDSLLASVSVRSKLAAVKSLSGVFLPDERMVWVEIHGLPKGAWNNQAITEITDKWGKGVFFDCEWVSGKSVAKVCLLSFSKSFIFEELSIMLGDKLFTVWLKEFAPWEPSILQAYSSNSGCGSSEGEYYDDSTDNDGKLDGNESSESDESGKSESFDSRLCADAEESNGDKASFIAGDNSIINSVSNVDPIPELVSSAHTTEPQNDANNNLVVEIDQATMFDSGEQPKDDASFVDRKIPEDENPKVGPQVNEDGKDQANEFGSGETQKVEATSVGCKIPEDENPKVGSHESLDGGSAVYIKDPDDIFSIDKILQKESKKKTGPASRPPTSRDSSYSESSGAPGFVKGFYPQPFGLVFSEQQVNGPTTPFLVSSCTASNEHSVLEIGNLMGIEIQDDARTFGQIISGMSADKGFQ